MTKKWNTSTRIIILTICLLFIAWFIYVTRSMIGPLIVAGLIAYLLSPVVKTIRKYTKLSHQWAVNLVFLFLLVVMIATPSTLVPVLVRQVEDLSAELAEIEQQIETFLESPVILMGQTISFERLWTDFLLMSSDSFTPAAESALTVLETTSVSLLWFLVIVITSYYLLMDWEGLWRWFRNLAPEGERDDIDRLLKEVDNIWRAYMRGTLALMLIMGIVFTIIGVAIGLPGAVAIGFITGLLSMIPEIGPFISGVLAVLVAYFQGSNYLSISNFWFATLVASIYIILMQVKSIWLRPIVLGRFLHMNTGLVFLAIIGAILLDGILAALIILPIIATIGVLGRYIRARLLHLDPWPANKSVTLLVATGPIEEPQQNDSDESDTLSS